MLTPIGDDDSDGAAPKTKCAAGDQRMRPTTAAGNTAMGRMPVAHLGCGFRSPAEFRVRAAEYIAEGLAHNRRIEFVGRGSGEQLRAELAALPGITERLNAGGVAVTPVVEFYAATPGTDVADPQVAVAALVAAVDEAIDDGYTGLCVIVEATAVAQRPEQREALARFEFLIDQQVMVRPLSALCGYDISQLAGAASELICLHPDAGPPAPSFRLYAEPGAAFALAGEIDSASDELYTTTLQRIWPLNADDPVIIDAQRLQFVSHQQLYTLDHYARADGRKVILCTDQPILTRLGGLLDLTNVETRPVGAQPVTHTNDPGRPAPQEAGG